MTGTLIPFVAVAMLSAAAALAADVATTFTSPIPGLDLSAYTGSRNAIYWTVWRGNYNDGGEGSGNHPGVDIPDTPSTIVVAVADGEVVSILRDWDPNGSRKEQNSGWGNHVVIKHRLPDGTVVFSSYNHLSSVDAELSLGIINRGTTLGNVGNTGAVISLGGGGYHLHFQLDRDLGGGHPYWTGGSSVNAPPPSDPEHDYVLTHTIDPIPFIRSHQGGVTGRGWRMPGFDAENSNASSASGPLSTPSPVVVERAIAGGLLGIADDGSVLTQSGSVLRYSYRGAERWRVDVDKLIDAVIGSDGSVYARTRDGITRLGREDGKPGWPNILTQIKHTDDPRPFGTFKIGNDDTLYDSTPGYLSAVRPDGRLKWEFPVGFVYSPSWMLNSDESKFMLSNCYAGYDCGSDVRTNEVAPLLTAQLHGLGPGASNSRGVSFFYGTGGSPYPVYACTSLDGNTPCASLGGVFEPAIIFTATRSGYLVTSWGALKGYDAAATLRWTVSLGAITGGFSDGRGNLYVMASPSGNTAVDGVLVALNGTTGSEIWRMKLASADQSGFVLGPEGCLYTLQAGSLTKWCE